MDMILNQSGITHLLQSFYAIAKVRVGFFDPLGKEITAYPQKHCDFCIMIRSSAKGLSACKQCDRLAYQRAVQYWKNSGNNYIYQCHAGLTEMIAPIHTSRNEYIGFLMIGQIQQSGYKEKWEEISGKVKEFCPNPDKLKAAYFKVSVMKMESIRACAHILQALAAYVWQENYIRTQMQPLSEKVKKYITDNLAIELNLSSIAQKFEIGKTTLCKYIKKDCGVTLNTLIRQIRIEYARQLLQNTLYPIYQIADQAGIPDYNYFAKVFKEETGVSPSLYRKLCENEFFMNGLKAGTYTRRWSRWNVN